MSSTIHTTKHHHKRSHHPPGLCNRRKWAEPVFEAQATRNGLYRATARVNNREYTTGYDEYPTPELAQDAAACQAYVICRNFSVNDGMLPGQRPNQGGVVQGLPVAIGTGRRSAPRTSERRVSHVAESSMSGSDSGSDRRSSSGSAVSNHASGICSFCGHSTFRAFDRCESCVKYGRPF